MRDESRQAGGEMVSPAAPKAPLGGGLSSSLIPHPSSLSSAWRAWLYLVVLSWQRQARARYMLWIALGLMAFSALFTGVQTARGRWGMGQWREPWRGSRLTYAQWEAGLETSSTALPWPAGQRFLQAALAGAARVTIRDSGVYVFSLALFGFFLTFLLPIWSLSFATEALGGEREGGSLLWLLTRPLPRPLVYLAKFVGLLPWSLALNLGGFALLCLAAGKPGRTALGLYWPAVFCGTLAFSALFLFIGAAFRRPAIVALLYSFFLETIFGNMPGYLKRASISFYTRCVMYDAGRDYNVGPRRPDIVLPVDGTTALCVLIGVTVALVALGMVWFARTEYVTID